jgi:hypothetical protein
MATGSPQVQQQAAIDQGLIDYYSAQADLMLVQYENINHLLGPTKDWTAPGTLCEILLRNVIRQSLPSSFSADKGFIYGRDLSAKSPTHSPEIDILIHDSHHYRPIFRMEDFVVVQAEAVRGVIQVKRMLDAGKLAKGLTNVLDATKHHGSYRRIGLNRETYFSALVGFVDKLGKREDGKPSETYRTTICREQIDRTDAAWYPDFIGNLDGLFLIHTGDNIKDIGYQVFESKHNDKNIALQIFLARLSTRLSHFGTRPTYSFPNNIPIIDYISLWNLPVSASESLTSGNAGLGTPSSS